MSIKYGPEDFKAKIEEINRIGLKSKGKTKYLKYLKGQRITRDEAIKAMCYDCEGYYLDGRQECHITTCPLYPFALYPMED